MARRQKRVGVMSLGALPVAVGSGFQIAVQRGAANPFGRLDWMFFGTLGLVGITNRRRDPCRRTGLSICPVRPRIANLDPGADIRGSFYSNTE